MSFNLDLGIGVRSKQTDLFIFNGEDRGKEIRDEEKIIGIIIIFHSIEFMV